MNTFKAGMLLGSLACARVMAADYSVGIVDAGSGFAGTGTALNVYAITARGVDLAPGSPFIFNQTVPGTANAYLPAATAVAPANDVAYVAYIGIPSLPILVQFKITTHGLVYQWQQEISTGDVSLQGTTLGTVATYVIERTFPVGSLWIHILNQSGRELVSDAGSTGSNLISGQIDPTGKFYYSCRYVSSSGSGSFGAANSVAVYRLESTMTDSTPPLATSNDPAFVQSECAAD